MGCGRSQRGTHFGGPTDRHENALSENPKTLTYRKWSALKTLPYNQTPIVRYQQSEGHWWSGGQRDVWCSYKSKKITRATLILPLWTPWCRPSVRPSCRVWWYLRESLVVCPANKLSEPMAQQISFHQLVKESLYLCECLLTRNQITFHFIFRVKQLERKEKKLFSHTLSLLYS